MQLSYINMKHKLQIFLLFLVLATSTGSIVAQPVFNKSDIETGDPAPKNGSLTGQVTDAATGLPLAGASLYFPDLRSGTAADSTGHFTFKYLPDGNFILDITYQGYSSRAIPVAINGVTNMDFQLSSTVVENDNVVVTGVSKATALKLSPVPVSIVKKAELNRSTASNIIEALGRRAGVTAVTTGPAVAKPFIRGLGYNRVITLNDGMRQEGQQWGDEHGIEIDEYSVQRVEVVKGPASLVYGSDAIAGVINIQSAIMVPENTIRANLTGSFNGNNAMWGSHADLAGKINGINFSAYGSSKQAGDYQNKYDGYVLNSRFRELNYGASLGINRHWGYSHASVSYFDQHLGVIEGERDSSGKFVLNAGRPEEQTATPADLKSRSLFIPNQQVTHLRVALDNSVKLGDGMLTALLGFQQNRRREFGDIFDPSTPQAYFDLATINYNIAYHFADNNGWKTSVGVSGMRQQNENKAAEALIPNYHLLDAGGYLLVQKNLHQKLALNGGIRFDNRHLVSDEMAADNGSVKFEAFTKNFTNISASAGVSYEVSKKLVVKGNISRGFRAPSAPELSANGEHEGTNRYEIGRNDLKNETSLQVDMGLEYTGTHLTFNLTPFYNNINHFIFLEKLQAANGSDSLTDDGTGNKITTYQYDQQKAHLAGLEFALDLHPHPLDWLHFENTVTLVRGKFGNAVDGSDNLPLIAPPRLVSELRGEWAKPGSVLENLYVKLEMDANARQNNAFTGYNTETETPGYTLFNLGLGTDLLIKKKKWLSVYLSLNNVADKAYQSHLSRLKYTDENLATGLTGVYNMGRNLTARVVVPLEFKIKS